MLKTLDFLQPGSGHYFTFRTRKGLPCNSWFQLLPIYLFLIIPAVALFLSPAAYAKEYTDAEVHGEAYQDISQVWPDIAQIVMRTRQLGYPAECNIEDLMRFEKSYSTEIMNLMALRDSTLGTIMEMAQNLREIFKEMESVFPGGPNAADYALKPTQEALGKLGPIGQVGKGVTKLLKNYADWHNANQASEIAKKVEARAKVQVNALKDGQQKLGEIDRALRELNNKRQDILELIRTYPERCLKSTEVIPGFQTANLIRTPEDARTYVYNATQAIDKCDLDALVRLLAFLIQQNAFLDGEMGKLSAQIISKFSELGDELAKFKGALPKYDLKSLNGIFSGIDDIKSGATGNLGSSGGADFKDAKFSDFSPLEDIQKAVDRAKAEKKLKDAAKKKMDELAALMQQRDEIMGTLGYIYKKQRYVEDLIATWEERCQKDKTALAYGYTALGSDYTDSEIQIGSDSPKWCSYREGTPIVFYPGGQTGEPGGPVIVVPGPSGGGDDPRDAGQPGGGDPRDVGTTCEQELKLLRTYMEKDGDALQRSARTNTQDAQDLNAIEERMRELKKNCGGGDPRDAGRPGGGLTTTPSGPTITMRPPDKDKPGGDDPRDTGEPTITIYIKAKSSATTSTVRTTARQRMKLFAKSTTNVALPGKGVDKPQTDYDKEPIQGTTDGNGNITLRVPGSAIGLKSTPTASTPALEIAIDTTAQSSVNAQIASGNTQNAVNSLPSGLRDQLSDVNVVNGIGFLTFTFPASMGDSVQRVLIRIPGVVRIEINYCRDKQGGPDDPLYRGNRAWRQKYDNQWAIKRIGLTAGPDSAWNLLGSSPKPVTIAVIDTGLDWNHLDIDWKNIWSNPGETPGNGVDDDRNGYIDDIIGWDFFAGNNKPWDHDGHGTIITGIIAAASNNGVGIAGINPHARIMVLKALNSFGHTRASYLAKAIVYAVDNGARIINMSVGGKEITTIEKEAIKYATAKGVLVVVAAGNEGIDVSNYGIAGLDGVVTVGSTDLDDKHAGFSNWGAQVDIAAPGLEVLSLRARRTDTMRDITDVEYKNAANYVGKDKRYYRASGTSFSAPIVTGVASLLLSKNSGLTGEELKRMLLQTAEDIEVPGIDQVTGYGMVDARAALQAEPGFFIEAGITGMAIAEKGGKTVVQVNGTADADRFAGAWVEIGKGENPDEWKKVTQNLESPVRDNVLGEIDANELRDAPVWTLRLITRHENGLQRKARFQLDLE